MNETKTEGAYTMSMNANPNLRKALSEATDTVLLFNRKNHAIIFGMMNGDYRSAVAMAGEPELILAEIAMTASKLYALCPDDLKPDGAKSIKDRMLKCEAMDKAHPEPGIDYEASREAIRRDFMIRTQAQHPLDNKTDFKELVHKINSDILSADDHSSVIVCAGKKGYGCNIEFQPGYYSSAEVVVASMVFAFCRLYPEVEVLLPSRSKIQIRTCADVIRYFDAWNVYGESRQLMPDKMMEKLLAVAGVSKEDVSKDPNNPTNIEISDKDIKAAGIDLDEMLQYASVNTVDELCKLFYADEDADEEDDPEEEDVEADLGLGIDFGAFVEEMAELNKTNVLTIAYMHDIDVSTPDALKAAVDWFKTTEPGNLHACTGEDDIDDFDDRLGAMNRETYVKAIQAVYADAKKNGMQFVENALGMTFTPAAAYMMKTNGYDPLNEESVNKFIEDLPIVVWKAFRGGNPFGSISKEQMDMRVWVMRASAKKIISLLQGGETEFIRRLCQ